MTKPKKIPSRLTISLPIEYIETYLQLCDAFELTRDQLFMILTSGNGLIDGGVEKIFPDGVSKSEWGRTYSQQDFSVCKFIELTGVTMDYLLFGLITILWFTVSTLCLNYFNDFCGCEDEWDSFPFWVKLPMRIFAPVLFLMWSR
ncbi:hypothetical protein [Alkalimarinus alittae]|uniref:Uncharacterized protein n=1 Tax=Alkalimarinus alittae TaxID=2961619 RepID=A0ABY6N526_9ALTE|nr:hypothetical protein [Alkalimarinus alittae]UZE97226.1 hypothetical protein NKI27_05615 [Alkalimarinus alittae]